MERERDRLEVENPFGKIKWRKLQEQQTRDSLGVRIEREEGRAYGVSNLWPRVSGLSCACEKLFDRVSKERSLILLKIPLGQT